MELTNIYKCLGQEPPSPNTLIKKFVLDSRQAGEDSCFFAIEGERSDGHDFVDKVYALGARLAIGTKAREPGADAPYLRVDDINQALLDLAACKRKQLGGKVLALIGNVGKSTSKEYLAGLLRSNYEVSTTFGNQNSLLGMPLTLLNASEESDVLVLEVGIDAEGGMRRLASVARPDDVLVTNLGSEHLEGLKTEEIAVAEELVLVTKVLKAGGRCILPMWNHWAHEYAVKHQKQYGQQIYGVWLNHSDSLETCKSLHNVHMTVDEEAWTLSFSGSKEKFAIPQLGVHNARNFALALAYADTFSKKPTPGKLQFNLLAGRTQLSAGFAETKLILDYYNAQEESVSAAITLLAEEAKKAGRPSVCILGDMLDLGTFEQRAHQNIARQLCSEDIDYVFLCGPSTQAHILPHLKPFYVRKKLNWLESPEKISEHLEQIPKNALILLKGSRGMQMERALPFLRSEGD